MASGPTRRRFLALASAAATGLAGCMSAGGSGEPVTVTPAPVPTDAANTAAPTDRLPPPPRPEDLEFRVVVLEDFGEARPARLEVAVTNEASGPVTALGHSPYVLPFVDDDYTGTDWSGDPEVLLVPDEPALTVAPAGADPGPMRRFLPSAPTDGCWSLPFDWPSARVPRSPELHAVPLAPGSTRRHRYGLYFTDACTTGTFSFAGTFDLAVGEPPIELGIFRARLAFDVAVSDTMVPLVRARDPVIRRPSDA